MPPNSNPITNNLPGLVLLILIIAVPLAFLVSIAFLRLYRRAVLRAMRSRADLENIETVTLEASASLSELEQAPLTITVLDVPSKTTRSSMVERLYADLLLGPWRAAIIYAIAGLCYALVTTVIFLIATKSEFHLLSFLIIFWYYAWPVVITICLVATATWRIRLVAFSLYFLTIIMLGMVAAAGNSMDNWLEMISLWLLTNFPAALLLLAFLNRRIQAVGPLMLTLMIFAVTGAAILPPLVADNENLIRQIVHIGVAVGLGGTGIYITLLLLGFVIFGGVGWFVLQKLGDWYQQKKISAQSIAIDTVWLLFGIFQSIGLIFEGERWFLISLLAFIVYKIAAWFGFSWLHSNSPSPQTTRSLLLLRVFSLGKKSERLFDSLSMYWRYVGSIRLIAGPDLATATLEPYEFLEFLGGKLARRFIDSTQTLERRVSQLDSEPDHDGQFRVSDFFCYDDTWRPALLRLVDKSDVVLMDLRGFSSQNSGVIFEIGELINLMPLEQVLFIVDQTTDELFLRQTFQQSWNRVKPTSPNRSAKSGRVNLFRLDKLREQNLKQILQALSVAANANLTSSGAEGKYASTLSPVD